MTTIPTAGPSRVTLRAAVLPLAVVLALTPMGLVRAEATAAAGGTQAECTVDVEETLSPGVGLTPTSGTFVTDPFTAPLACTGTIDGKSITGPGTWAETGRYGIARPYGCGDTSGDFTQRTTITLPTSAGRVKLVSDGAGTFGPLQGGGVIGGSLSGPRMHKTFTIFPVQGNCVSAPISRAALKIHAWLTDD